MNGRLDQNDDILEYVGHHPTYGKVQFKQVRQDGRVYYRLTGSRLPLTKPIDAKRAREHIEYWNRKGWFTQTAVRAS
jgi:hypothetical protein